MKYEILSDGAAVARAAAAKAVQELVRARDVHGTACWVLAGGTSPTAAYRVVVEEHRGSLTLDGLRFLVGDERCVAEDDPASNWGQITHALLDPLGVPSGSRLTPKGELGPEGAAEDYARQLQTLTDASGRLRLDHVWLGLGEDGHTLSLFPGSSSLEQRGTVLPIRDSPKPPPERITLSLGALECVNDCVVLAVGTGKADAVARAWQGDDSLPIVLAIRTVKAHGGQVVWLLDEGAASRL